MELHGNARLTPVQTDLMCERVRLEGWTSRRRPTAAGCSERTGVSVVGPLRRRESRVTDRSSAPTSVPATNTTEGRSADRAAAPAALDRHGSPASSTWRSRRCARCLQRLGLNRLWQARSRRSHRTATAVAIPASSIHVDVKKLGRFNGPGTVSAGRGRARRPASRAGWEAVHVAVDDTTRLAYVESPRRRESGRPASAFFAEPSPGSPPTASRPRVMTDNGTGYRSTVRDAASPSSDRSTSAPGPTGPGPTAKPNGSSRPCSANGPTPPATAAQPTDDRCTARLARLLQQPTTTQRPRPQDTRQPPPATDERPWDLQLGPQDVGVIAVTDPRPV